MPKYGVFFSLQNIWNIVFDFPLTLFTLICQMFDIDIFLSWFTKKKKIVYI